MMWNKALNIIIVFWQYAIICQHMQYSYGCVFLNGKYDLSALNGATTWPVTYSGNEVALHYDISICNPLNYKNSPGEENCANSSICKFVGENATSMGDYIMDKTDFRIYNNIQNSGFTMYFKSSPCQHKNTTLNTAVITFICGKNLGSPKLVSYGECSVNFLWESSAACVKKPQRKEVQCYVIDAQGNKRDLTNLIMRKGGYQVKSSGKHEDFFFNVCSDILPDTATEHCPTHSSACRMDGTQYISVGEPETGLQLEPNGDGLMLTYSTGNNKSSGCALPPKTTVLFRCPYKGQYHYPKLISEVDCQYEIEWATDHACPEYELKGDFNKCQFTNERHGLDIDLSPLKLENGVYNISGNGSDTVFTFNVCGGLGGGTLCGGNKWKSAAACLMNSTSKTYQLTGVTTSATFNYADGDILLTYEGGEPCFNERRHKTIISFQCNHNAGKGEPEHISSEECVHMFKWETKFACSVGSTELSCYAMGFGTAMVDDFLIFDLNGLKRERDEEPWLALDETRLPGKGKKTLYYLNICGYVPSMGNFSGCERDAAVCMLDDGKYVNLGTLVSPPAYNSKTGRVWLKYENGSQCGTNGSWKSSIEFFCKPGDLTSSPVLVNINNDDCTYEFHWQTLRGCPKTSHAGEDCRVTDNFSGINYDLSPLKNHVYIADTGDFTFEISVCSPLMQSSCPSASNDSLSSVGACQVEKSSEKIPKAWKIGNFNSDILYSDGDIVLHYIAGDPYNDTKKSPRETLIIFMCDMNAGSGSPTFIESVMYTYIFHWHTYLVCQQAASNECAVYNSVTNEYYNLSPLSKVEHNWALFLNKGETRKAYINVCRPLIPTENCDSNAAACIVNTTNGTESSYIKNIGHAISKPVVTSEGHLMLLYSNGQQCSDPESSANNFTTIIYFLCSKDELSFDGPRFLGRVGQCQYAFLWTTNAACPTGQIFVNDECSLTDPNTGFVFDLHTLNNEDSYTIDGGKRKFQINICGSVKNGCQFMSDKTLQGNVSACEIDGDGKTVSVLGTTNGYTLQYFQGSNVILKYKNEASSGKGNASEVIISFPCDNMSSEVKPHFLKEEKSGKYYFEVKTPLTCITDEFVCEFVDQKGYEYDLSPLSRRLSVNWQASSPSSDGHNTRYFINFCRPLNKVPNLACPGGATGACEIDLKSGQGFSLGSQYSMPNVSENDFITLLYTGGSPCTSGLNRTARITLFCSHYQGELIFSGKTPECEYLFSMHSPAACPLQTSIGQNCMVTDPIFGHNFNLNPLKNATANFTAISGEYTYYLNVCDKLEKFSGACKNSSVCQTKSGNQNFQKSLGLPNSQITYSKGVISLTYLFGTDKCHKKYNRSSVIKFTCDHGSTGITDGPIFISEAEDCTYLFEWATSYACPPFDVVDCIAEGSDGMQYDLSALSLSNDNYYINNPVSTNQTFVINVCRSVVHSSDSLCPYMAASCRLDPDNQNLFLRTLNLGIVSSSPYFEDGVLRIKYPTGDVCDIKIGNTIRFIESIIEFICEKGKTNTEPEFYGRDGCTFYFRWYTAYACPINTTETVEDCSVNDPYTDFRFDMSPLKRIAPYIVQSSNHQFSISVCSALKKSCGPNSGLCQQELDGDKRIWNAGDYNTNLQYTKEGLFLNYSGGAPCHNNMFKRSSIINFECAEGTEEPKFLFESNDCTYYFMWKTELACQPLVHCAVKNGSYFYNLNPLGDIPHFSAETQLEENDNSLYYISVCHDFRKLPNPLCPPSSSLCRVSADGTFAESLGRVEYPPFVDFQGHATILFTNGSVCSSNSEERNRARIIFLCDRSVNLGEPTLISKPEDCIYIFEWRSAVVCPPEQPVIPKEKCIFDDLRKGVHFDLSPLHQEGSYYKIATSPEDEFRINFCGPISTSSQCGSSAICRKNQDGITKYGKPSSLTFVYDEERLIATYSDGDDCLLSEHGKRAAQIYFICDPNAGLGTPRLSKKFICLASFVWATSLVCKSRTHSCSFDLSGRHYDLHLLSSLSHNWKTSDGKGNTFSLNPCYKFHDNDINLHCSAATAVCLRDQRGESSSLGVINSVTAKIAETGEFILSYAFGSSYPCATAPGKNSAFLNATSKIFFSCGKSLGTPKWRSGPNADCVYEFSWETSVVCNKTMEEVTLNDNGILIDERFQFFMNLSDILNRTFHSPGKTGNDSYVYVTNLGLGYGSSHGDNNTACTSAAVCQVKAAEMFYRDIGGLGTSRFIIRGSELHIQLTSNSAKPCGKNPNRNVTTLINMQCSIFAGIGSPSFLYESGGCDYIFNWETHAVCPIFKRNDSSTVSPATDEHQKGNDSHTSNNENQEGKGGSSNHAVAIVLTFIVVAIVVCPIIFVVSNARRRSAVAMKCRSLFSSVYLPHFQYRRGDMLTELQSDF